MILPRSSSRATSRSTSTCPSEIRIATAARSWGLVLRCALYKHRYSRNSRRLHQILTMRLYKLVLTKHPEASGARQIDNSALIHRILLKSTQFLHIIGLGYPHLPTWPQNCMIYRPALSRLPASRGHTRLIFELRSV
jgi:hypothetical protein